MMKLNSKSITPSRRTFFSLLKSTTPVLSSTLVSQERPKLEGSNILPPGSSTFGGDFGSTRGLLKEAKKKDVGGSEKKSEERSEKEKKNSTVGTQSAPYKDELNTLLRHPTLYDPILAPRYPIVLCHGLYGFDVRGPAFFRLHYWGDLLKILRGKVGAEVFVTAVPGTGSIKTRAHILHQSLEETPEILGRDLNFLAHSMGGLDARYLLSSIRPTTYNPRSLTTISTPHRGSEFMAWCRANIGIGTDFDKTSEAAAKFDHESDEVTGSSSSSSSKSSYRSTNAPTPNSSSSSTVALPFSLKHPILTRSVSQTIKDDKTATAAQLASQQFPGIPTSLSSSFSSYLLDLLDSPAYANLTPNFMQDVFNPATPDREDVKYYSIAARVEKIGIWHPLWLPKLVLDGAATARWANGTEVEDPRWRGNDGLVNVESAKWGEFLGVLEGCDHWEARGSSGIIAEVKAVTEAAVGHTLVGGGSGKDGNGAMAVLGLGTEKEKTKRSWQWKDVYALVGKKSDKSSKSEESEVVKASSTSTSNSTKVNSTDSAAVKAEKEDATGIATLASWITEKMPSNVHLPHLPHIHLKSTPPFVETTSTPSTETNTSNTSSTSTSDSKSTASNVASATAEARLQYGAPVPSNSNKNEKFNLERMTLAVCRKLYQEGL